MNDKEILKEMFGHSLIKFKDLKVDNDGKESVLNIDLSNEYLYFLFDRSGQLKDVYTDN